MDLNRVWLMGNVGKDPDIKYLDNGKLARFSIATSFKYKDNEYTEWHNIVCFDEKLVDIIEKYVQKGTRVWIEGENRTRKYEQNGENKYMHEVIIPKFRGNLILIARSKGGGQETPASQPQQDDPFDDVIPF